MAVAYQSTSTTAWGSRGTITITHPTGLTAGDLMVATIATNSDAMSTPSGWTLLNSGGGISPYDFLIYWKVATDGDVSGGSTSWTGGSTEDKWGNITRFNGNDTTTPIDVSSSGSASSGATPSISATITPTRPNTILMQLWTGKKSGSETINASSYAIANNNPTWAEIIDAPKNNLGDSGNSVGIGLAYGSYSPTSATGNSSVGWSASFDNSYVVILAVRPLGQSFTLTETLSLSEIVTNLRTRLFTLAETLALSETTTVLKGIAFVVFESLGLTEVFISLRTRLFTVTESLGIIEVLARVKKKWNNQDKNSSSWSNQTRNSSTWTNQSKN